MNGRLHGHLFARASFGAPAKAEVFAFRILAQHDEVNFAGVGQRRTHTRIELGRSHADELVDEGHYCFARAGQVYAVYIPKGGTTTIDLGKSKKTYSVRWYNPRKGGELLTGSVTTVFGGGKKSVGKCPADEDKDWVVLLK